MTTSLTGRSLLTGETRSISPTIYIPPDDRGRRHRPRPARELRASVSLRGSAAARTPSPTARPPARHRFRFSYVSVLDGKFIWLKFPSGDATP
ncbi:hypothetical protein GUJ93_ZPchr0011g27252 [Zizania palustris]|uniref:Uncharacterized protein n=1 Tax=Zizania palustris TaxID=103762 RepID=A0A8J5WLA3_ZIZPA|nr:hypothetical protein GUJ93_ZPchr0011g27252 [Zizania palustris]